MGVIGTGVFDDDYACDVRGDFEDLLGEGKSTEAATKALAKRSRSKDDESVFWLALAMTQWNLGRLQDDVKAKALRIISDGSDLKRWAEDPATQRERRTVLAAVAKKLQKPQPKAKRGSRRYQQECDWKLGELIIFRLKSGTPIYMRVVGFSVAKGGKMPVCEALDLGPKAKLTIAAVSRAPVKPFRSDPSDLPPGLLGAQKPTFAFGALEASEIPIDRLERTHIITEPKHPLPPPQAGPRGIQFAILGFRLVLWRDADEWLSSLFDVT